MKHKRVIVDSYVSLQNKIEVEGRYNHASSTEVDVERKFSVRLARIAAVNQGIEDGFELVSSPEYNFKPATSDFNSLTDSEPIIETHTNAINRSIDSLKYQPDGCGNSYECFPKEQSFLVPYLVDDVVRRNNNFYNPSAKKLEVLTNEHTQIWYDPSFFGDIFVSTFGDTAAAPNVVEGNVILQQGAGNPHLFNVDGLHSRHLIRFSSEVDGLIPVVWASDDTIVCQPARVSIHDSVFGLAADVYVDFDLQNSLFAGSFNEMGLFRLQGGNAYGRAVAQFNEMMQVNITAMTVGPAVAVTNATGENANISMWLRRPSYCRGCIINKDVHPGIRLLGAANLYFGHQDNRVPIGGGVAVPDANPRNIPTRLEVYPRFLSKRKGTNVPADGSRRYPLGQWSIEFQSSNIHQNPRGYFEHDLRTFGQFRLRIDNLDLYQYLRDNGNATTTRALILETDTFVQLHIPTITQQHSGVIPTEPGVPLVLWFQKRHATYDDASQEVRMTRVTLKDQGGADNWGYGRPLLCPLSELTGLRDDAGVILQDAGGNDISIGLLDPLGVKSGMQNALEGTYTFNTVISTENNNTLTHGTKVLFEDDEKTEMWSHRIRFRPWVKVQRQVTTDPAITPPASVQLIVYPNNDVALADAGNQVSSIQYHLYDSDALTDEHRAVYHGLDDDTKAHQWDGYINQARIQWLKIQGQATTDPNTQVVTHAYYLWTNANQAAHADGPGQVSATAYYRLRTNTDWTAAFAAIGEATRRVWYAEYYAANNLAVDELLRYEHEQQHHEDILLEHLTSMRGTISTLAPHFFEERGTKAAQPVSLKNIATVTLREKLFGYKTINCLRPDKIFPQFGEFYPIALQDYNLTFQVSSDPERIFKHSQTKVADLDPTIQIEEVVSTKPTRIYVRSRDSVDQNEKELVKVNYFYPELQRFTSTASHVGETTNDPVAVINVSCVTGSRMPDYLFIYSERISQTLEVYEHECPKIASVKISRNKQPTRIYNSGELTHYDLFDCTRRNSHPRANMEELYKEFGGVLLSKFDLGTLLGDELATYRLELDFEITLVREPDNEVTLTLPEGLADVLDDNLGNNEVSDLVTDPEALKILRYNVRIQQPTRTTVLFIYENGSHLQGQQRKLVFKKTMI